MNRIFLSFILIFSLTATVVAGGDSDVGPIEFLDHIQYVSPTPYAGVDEQVSETELLANKLLPVTDKTNDISSTETFSYRRLYSIDSEYEALESYVPMADNLVVTNEKAKEMLVPKSIIQHIGQATGALYNSCEDNFNSDSVLVRYTCIITTIGILAL